MESLLGQFYTRIKGSQEDIASEGLTYVLQRSSVARQALNKVIQMDSGLTFEDISYSTQNIGEKLERPDISGIDKDGKEVIILEAKFWASLTDNQPVEYLRRLGNNSVLMFVTPTLRVRPIYNEIQIRLAQAEIDFVPDNTNHSFSLNHNQKLIIKTWNEILQAIRQQLEQANEQTLLSDIDQVIGLCATIDNNSFQPYQSEDFSPSNAKKINSYYDLTDNIIEELKKGGSATNIRSASQKYSYTRYFRIGTVGLSLNVRFDLWEKIADTPFWLCLYDDIADGSNWKQTEAFKAQMKNTASRNSIIPYESNKRELFIPVRPLTDKTEDLVINDMANQIVKLADELATNH
jgi:hypothetical protein